MIDDCLQPPRYSRHLRRGPITLLLGLGLVVYFMLKCPRYMPSMPCVLFLHDSANSNMIDMALT